MPDMNAVLTCDVLVVGGGNGGMSAAISAADAGASIIVAEKANTLRSGAGATGNDHFQCYVPEVHGSFDEGLKLLMHDRPGFAGRDMDCIVPFMNESLDVVKEWESWGIDMHPHGYWEFTGHTLPWVKGTHLKYAGVNQKPIMTREALKRGVRILNRCPLLELLQDDAGTVCGAICVDVGKETPALQVIYAKSVILATTSCSQLTGNSRMAWPSNSYGSPSGSSGEAIVAAYNAGARMVGFAVTGGMSPVNIAVSRFMRRGGARTWVGTYTDMQGNPYGAIGATTTYDVLNPGTPGEPHEITKPDWKTGDYTQYLPENTQKKAYINGKPVFMNFSANSEEDTEYMKWALVHEGNSSTLDHLAAEGFDFSKHMVEFADCGNAGGKCGGVDTDGRGETSVKGLFAAAGCIGNSLPGLSPAVVSGRIAGRNAAAYSRETALNTDAGKETIRASQERIDKLLNAECSTATPTWSEIEVAVKQTMWEYCGSGIVSNDFFTLALKHLKRIEQKAEELQCPTSHDLMRAIGAQSTVKCAELAVLAAMDIRESRGAYKHADYPETNHEYDGKLHTLQKIDGKAVTGLRAIRTETDCPRRYE